MKKRYPFRITFMLAFMLASLMVFGQKIPQTIIVVGADADTPRAYDQSLIDSVSNWVEEVVYLGQTAFNDADADDLYTDAGHNADGVIISESIGASNVKNFAQTDNYPVPCITLETTLTNDNVDRWPLLLDEPDGGIWGYDPPEDVDMQWRIVNDEHYITEGYNIDDVITYGDISHGYGVPYVHGIEVEHIILATAVRTDGGSNATFNQDQAIACAYLLDPEILYMNVAHEYLSDESAEWYGILKRGVLFLFDNFPEDVDPTLAGEINLSVFPNPTAEEATLKFSVDAGKTVSVDLINVVGGLVGNIHKGVSAGGEKVIPINTTDYASGIYLVKVQIDGQAAYSRLILR